nr:4-hydroxyphenylpyruvate dioxygenase [Ipomoea batatas]
MPSPLPTYYKNLKSRFDGVLNDEQIKECEELGILVDRDGQGTVLQIFTKPVGDMHFSIFKSPWVLTKNWNGKSASISYCRIGVKPAEPSPDWVDWVLAKIALDLLRFSFPSVFGAIWTSYVAFAPSDSFLEHFLNLQIPAVGDHGGATITMDSIAV